MSTGNPLIHKAIDGLSYKVVGSLLSSETKHEFAREFFLKKIVHLEMLRKMGEHLFEDKAFLKSGSVLELPIDKFLMMVFTAKECIEKDGNVVLWAKDDKLNCPVCEPLKTGRECFQGGAQHELILPFLGFWAGDSQNSVQGCRKTYPSYGYYDEKKGDYLACNTKAIETFPIPLNVKCNDRIEIFLLVPRACSQKTAFYFWQYRLLDRFVSKRIFNNHCRICGSRSIVMDPDVALGGYSFDTAMSSRQGDRKLEKILDEKSSGYIDLFFKSSRKFFCNNCREYSFIFQESDFAELQCIEGKGLCSKCYKPAEHLIEKLNVLKCSHCGASTPLYNKLHREIGSKR